MFLMCITYFILDLFQFCFKWLCNKVYSPVETEKLEKKHKQTKEEKNTLSIPMHEKYPYSEFLGKYGPEKLRIQRLHAFNQ